MEDEELKSFLNMATPMLCELSDEEIQRQLDYIDMSDEERAHFYKVLMVLREEE